MWKWIVVFSFVASPFALAEQKDEKLSGTFGFIGEECMANPKSKACNITIVIEGGAAKAVYDRMPAKAADDWCTEGKIKEDGNGMRCFKVGAEYSCDFGYSFTKRKMTNSNVTC